MERASWSFPIRPFVQLYDLSYFVGFNGFGFRRFGRVGFVGLSKGQSKRLWALRQVKIVL